MIELLVAGLLLGPINSDTPPVKYQGNTGAIIITVDDPNQACGPAPEGFHFLACTEKEEGAPVIRLPNPCLYDKEQFAHILCHELGHVNGWNANHDN